MYSAACNYREAVFRLRNGRIEESIKGQVGLFCYETGPLWEIIMILWIYPVHPAQVGCLYRSLGTLLSRDLLFGLP